MEMFAEGAATCRICVRGVAADSATVLMLALTNIRISMTMQPKHVTIRP